MKIVKLEIENFKRLKAVEITPDEYIQVIGGENAQGKTSVMDAIWSALAGGTATKSITNPVREGEKNASVKLDLGNIVVTRTWKGGSSTLKVEAQNGGVFSSPQKMLDELLGRLSFDPLEFTRLTPKQQVNALLDISGLGETLDALAANREKLYEERKGKNYDRNVLNGRVKDLGEMETAPDIKIDQREAFSAWQNAVTINNSIRSYNAEKERITNEIKRLTQELNDVNVKLLAQGETQDEFALQKALEEVSAINEAVERNEQRAIAYTQWLEADAEWQKLDNEITKIDEAKKKVLETAPFPVEGISFDDEGVLFNGIPFSQASSAEQIKVSLGMAMALNPKVRVIRIMDGSLLDSASMKMVSDMAHERDYQIFIERVGNADAMAVIIEDGEVK